jgi:hypothetical protein
MDRVPAPLLAQSLARPSAMPAVIQASPPPDRFIDRAVRGSLRAARFVLFTPP